MTRMSDDAAELEAYRFLVVKKRRQLLFDDVNGRVELRSSDKNGAYVTFHGATELEALFNAVAWHAQNWTPFEKDDEPQSLPYGLLSRAMRGR